MPYDSADGTWKFCVQDKRGRSSGIIKEWVLFHPDNLKWTGKHSSDPYFQVLVRIEDEDGTCRYYLLHRFDASNFTSRDYCVVLNSNEAARWLYREAFDKPKELSQVAIPTQITSFPADHYKSKYGIAPNTLNKARREGRISGEKLGGRWFYPLLGVQKLWPDVFPEEDETGRK